MYCSLARIGVFVLQWIQDKVNKNNFWGFGVNHYSWEISEFIIPDGELVALCMMERLLHYEKSNYCCPAKVQAALCMLYNVTIFKFRAPKVMNEK